MKLYVYKLYTIYTCVSRILSTDSHVFLCTWGSRETPFFSDLRFLAVVFYTNRYTTISIVLVWCTPM
jgi:hypothetical protein